jgi:uncharacterized protein (TIGR00369 family)
MAETQDPTIPLFARMKEFSRAMLQGVPHANALGFTITDIAHAKAWATAPYRPDLIGDPDTGVIAGGVIIALLDNLSGVAAMAALDEPTSIATLDLRIDYMRPAEPGKEIKAMAHCFRVARSVAFVRACAYEETEDDPIAQSSAAFMLGSDGGRRPGANLKDAKPTKRAPK